MSEGNGTTITREGCDRAEIFFTKQAVTLANLLYDPQARADTAHELIRGDRNVQLVYRSTDDVRDLAKFEQTLAEQRQTIEVQHKAYDNALGRVYLHSSETSARVDDLGDWTRSAEQRITGITCRVRTDKKELEGKLRLQDGDIARQQGLIRSQQRTINELVRSKAGSFGVKILGSAVALQALYVGAEMLANPNSYLRQAYRAVVGE